VLFVNFQITNDNTNSYGLHFLKVIVIGTFVPRG